MDLSKAMIIIGFSLVAASCATTAAEDRIASGHITGYIDGNAITDIPYDEAVASGFEYGDIITLSAGELSILQGSIVFDGDAESGSAVLTSTGGEDVILTGTLNSGVSVTIVQGSETVNVPVRFDNFNDNGGIVTFQSYGAVESSETIPDWVDAVFAGNIMLGGLTITNSAEYIYNGTSQYPSNMLASVSGMTSQGFINKTLDGLAISNSDLGIYKIDGEGLVQAEAVDAGTYYVYYGYFVDGVLHSYLCEWVIQTADATIDFDSIDKTYDGTIALESSDAVTVADVPNVVFGTPVYEDMNVGYDKAVILTVEFQNGATPSNYTFSINEQVVERAPGKHLEEGDRRHRHCSREGVRRKRVRVHIHRRNRRRRRPAHRHRDNRRCGCRLIHRHFESELRRSDHHERRCRRHRQLRRHHQRLQRPDHRPEGYHCVPRDRRPDH